MDMNTFRAHTPDDNRLRGNTVILHTSTRQFTILPHGSDLFCLVFGEPNHKVEHLISWIPPHQFPRCTGLRLFVGDPNKQTQTHQRSLITLIARLFLPLFPSFNHHSETTPPSSLD
jgi:hypothetical protein